MDDKRKQELFPYFAYLYSKQMNPDKYGSVSSVDDWISLIQENEQDVSAITQAAENLSEDEWNNIDKQYIEETENSKQEEIQFAAKGAKLKKLKSGTKKCSCGCDMITVKEEGGKISSKCSCNCKGGTMSKKETGGVINSKILPDLLKCGGKAKGKVKKKQVGGEIKVPGSNIKSQPLSVPIVKKQSGGDINQPIGTTKKGGKAPDRIKKKEVKPKSQLKPKEKVTVVTAPALKDGGKWLEKINKKKKTKK